MQNIIIKIIIFRKECVMKEIKTNDYLIRIYFPEITKEETARRMKHIQKEAENLLKSYERRKRE